MEATARTEALRNSMGHWSQHSSSILSILASLEQAMTLEALKSTKVELGYTPTHSKYEIALMEVALDRVDALITRAQAI
jgi:hypothetical protein